MPGLAGEVDYVVGVDTRRDAHTAAAVDRLGGVLEGTTVSASQRGAEELLSFARASAPGRRCWAIEGTGLYGAGLTRFLLERGERVVEIERPGRPARRRGKSDEIDALAAAREGLAGEHLSEPRSPGQREALQAEGSINPDLLTRAAASSAIMVPRPPTSLWSSDAALARLLGRPPPAASADCRW